MSSFSRSRWRRSTPCSAAPRTRHALTLAGWFVLQSLTSIYLLVLTAVAMMAAAAVRPREWLGRRLGPVGGRLVLAAAISGAALWPYLQAYWQVHQEHGVTRTLFDVELYSASWKDYLSSPSRIHLNAWSHWLYSGTPLFPGLVPIGLAAIAIFCGRAWRDSRARMCLAFGICGVVLSFGIKIPGYAWLYEMLTPLQAVRAVSRFGYLGIAAVGVPGRVRPGGAAVASVPPSMADCSRDPPDLRSHRTDGGADSVQKLRRRLEDL